MEVEAQNGLLRTIGHAVDSVVKVELLLFFAAHPTAMDSAKGLSMWLGRDEKSVEKAANELVEAAILVRYGEGEEAIYMLSQDPQVKDAVCHFVSAELSCRERRESFIKQLIHKEARK
ncbi:MAG: hypothetical protein RUDDFDWM_000808 [Candidatus Fervidibacterota bacterium]